MADVFLITDEGDLWRLLERVAAGRTLPEPDVIQVAGWNPNLLYFPDEPIGHSLSPSMARAVTGFHAGVSRSYAYLAYGRADARILRADDEGALDLRMLVLSGSNGLDVLGGALDRLTHAIIHKLSRRQTTTVIVMFLLLHFGADVAKDWLHEEYQRKIQEAEVVNRIKLSEQETARLQILAAALDQNPGLKHMAEIAADSKVPLVRSVLSYDRARVLGTEITHDEAAVILSKEKEKGKGQRLDGRFEVVEIDVENPGGYMGTLRDVKTHQEVKVSINRIELPDTDIKALFEALERKAAVDALVNAWFVGDKITAANVVRVNPVAPSAQSAVANDTPPPNTGSQK